MDERTFVHDPTVSMASCPPERKRYLEDNGRFKDDTSQGRKLAAGLIDRENTPDAMKFFEANSRYVRDSTYWYFLACLWISHTGGTDLERWKRLFRSTRPERHYLMNREELAVYDGLPEVVACCRGHRPGETDWIAYSINPTMAAGFAYRYKNPEIRLYTIPKKHIICFLSRNKESELICLDKSHVRFEKAIGYSVVDNPEPPPMPLTHTQALDLELPQPIPGVEFKVVSKRVEANRGVLNDAYHDARDKGIVP